MLCQGEVGLQGVMQHLCMFLNLLAPVASSHVSGPILFLGGHPVVCKM